VLKVFNVVGKEVATLLNGIQEAVIRRVNFDGSGLSSGLYFYRLEARPTDGVQTGGFVETRKALLLK
jgi:hypothetical protein